MSLLKIAVEKLPPWQRLCLEINSTCFDLCLILKTTKCVRELSCVICVHSVEMKKLVWACTLSSYSLDRSKLVKC